MKKLLITVFVVLGLVSNLSAKLIQHTDQIAEIEFTGSAYELGLYTGEVAKKQILESIKRFDNILGVMLPGLSTDKLAKKFKEKKVFEKIQKTSPYGSAYISGLAKALDKDINILLAVAMSDEAILESQANGGIGFLQTETQNNLRSPAKCSVMGISDKKGKAWAGANFDYMGINYTGLIVLNHTDKKGEKRVILTWAGLIPYGGISVGGQAILMNTMADEGTAREKAKGEIIADDATPSFYLSWEAYGIHQPKEIIDIFKKYKHYTAFFSYTIVDSELPVLTIENNYGGKIHYGEGDYKVHTNHSLYNSYKFMDDNFGAHTLTRYKTAEKFMKKANMHTSEKEVRNLLESKPLWKGRGELMGTVTSTYYKIDGKQIDMYVKTDASHPSVHIKNYK